jgi:hypothetical protein
MRGSVNLTQRRRSKREPSMVLKNPNLPVI